MKTRKEIVKRHFGDDYHALEHNVSPFNIEQVMEEYATQQAVEFSDWLEKYYEKFVFGRWEIKDKPEKGNWTTKELYELFTANG